MPWPKGKPRKLEIELPSLNPAFYVRAKSHEWIDPTWEVEITLSVAATKDERPTSFSWFLTDDQLNRFKRDIDAGELGTITYRLYEINRKEEVA